MGKPGQFQGHSRALSASIFLFWLNSAGSEQSLRAPAYYRFGHGGFSGPFQAVDLLSACQKQLLKPRAYSDSGREKVLSQ
jgi:hypothetical protein